VQNDASTFKRDNNKVIRQMKKTKQPVELKERLEVVKVLRERLTSPGRKKGRPAEDFFNEFFAENAHLVVP
jgi:hypothetical protein